jgi:hypothetical protein
MRMQKTSWTDRLKNGKMLHTVTEERNILHEINRRKVNWIGHSLRRNRLLKHIIEEKIGGVGVTARRGRRSMQLQHDFKEMRG